MNALMTGLLPFGDTLMWVGISITGALGITALMAPRWIGRSHDRRAP